jgi:hypothetical protein
VRTISAEVAVSGSVGGHRLRGRLLAGLAAPSSVYIEAPAPFGAPLFVLGGTATDATLLLPRDRRVLEHGRTSEILEALAGVPLTPSDLQATLTGCTANDEGVGEARQLGNDWRVLPGTSTRYLHRDEPGGPWRLVSVVGEGADGWRSDFRDFADDLPRSVRLVSNEARRFDLRLDLSQVEVNADLDPSTFRVRIPAGTQPISIDELRASGPLTR